MRVMIFVLSLFFSLVSSAKISSSAPVPKTIDLWIAVCEEAHDENVKSLRGTALKGTNILVIVDKDTLKQVSFSDRPSIFSKLPVNKKVEVIVSKKGYIGQRETIITDASDKEKLVFGKHMFISFTLKKEESD